MTKRALENPMKIRDHSAYRSRKEVTFPSPADPFFLPSLHRDRECFCLPALMRRMEISTEFGWMGALSPKTAVSTLVLGWFEGIPGVGTKNEKNRNHFPGFIQVDLPRAHNQYISYRVAPIQLKIRRFLPTRKVRLQLVD